MCSGDCNAPEDDTSNSLKTGGWPLPFPRLPCQAGRFITNRWHRRHRRVEPIFWIMICLVGVVHTPRPGHTCRYPRMAPNVGVVF